MADAKERIRRLIEDIDSAADEIWLHKRKERGRLIKEISIMCSEALLLLNEVENSPKTAEKRDHLPAPLPQSAKKRRRA